MRGGDLGRGLLRRNRGRVLVILGGLLRMGRGGGFGMLGYVLFFRCLQRGLRRGG